MSGIWAVVSGRRINPLKKGTTMKIQLNLLPAAMVRARRQKIRRYRLGGMYLLLTAGLITGVLQGEYGSRCIRQQQQQFRLHGQYVQQSWQDERNRQEAWRRFAETYKKKHMDGLADTQLLVALSESKPKEAVFLSWQRDQAETVITAQAPDAETARQWQEQLQQQPGIGRVSLSKTDASHTAPVSFQLTVKGETIHGQSGDPDELLSSAAHAQS